jgi:hypothetical protein
MVQPTNYMLSGVDPAQALVQSLPNLQNMQMNRQTMQVNDQAIQENQYKLAEMQRQQQQAAARKAAYDARRTELLDGATDANYLRNALRLRSEFPEFNAGADAVLKEMGDARRQQTYQTAMQVRSLVAANQHAAAKEMLMSQAAALRNAGDEQNAKATESLAQAMVDAPSLAPQIAANIAAMTMPPNEAAEMLKADSEAEENRATATKTTAEAAEVAANAANERAARLANIEARIEQNRIAQQRANTAADQVEIARQNTALRAEAQQLVRAQWIEKISTLPPALQPTMTEYVEKATDQASLANRTEALAAEMSRLSTTSAGGDGRQYRTIAEYLKSSLGAQDEYSRARQQYLELRTKGIGEMLKDFKPASNSDMDMVAKPFPSENDEPKYLAQYLAAMGRVSRMAATVAESKAEWLQSNRGMGKTMQPVEIMGTVVPAGVTYPQFRAQYLPAIVDRVNGQGATTGQTATAPTASYMQLVK